MEPPRQLSFPFSQEGRPKKKRVHTISPDQASALTKIAKSMSDYVIGIDEVGLGSWAGPMTVGVVVLPRTLALGDSFLESTTSG